MVLGLEMLDTEHIIGGGDVRKQGCNDECDAHNVKPAGFWCRDACLTPRDTNGPREGQCAQQ